METATLRQQFSNYRLIKMADVLWYLVGSVCEAMTASVISANLAFASLLSGHRTSMT